MNQVIRPRGCLPPSCAIRDAIKGLCSAASESPLPPVPLALTPEPVSPEFVKMPRLLRSVLCVIETFHKYSREDGDKARLTCRELKRLLQGEFGDFLQPHVMHAVERNLSLVDSDKDGTISFDEFVLAIFSLLNLCYVDIQSLRSAEPRQVSKSEKNPDEELADLPEPAAARNPPETQRSSDTEDESGTSVVQEPEKDAAGSLPETRGWEEPEACGRASKTPEPPAQGRGRETTDPPAQGGSRSVPEPPDVGAQGEEGARSAAQKGRGRVAQEAHSQDGQRLQEPSRERDAETRSGTRFPGSEGRNQGRPETGKAPIPGEEAKDAEDGPAAEGTPAAPGRTRESGPPGRPSAGHGRGETGRAAGTGDQPVREDPELPPNAEGSCETPDGPAPQEGHLGSERRELRVRGRSQGHVDPHRGSVQGAHRDHPDAQKQGPPGDHGVREAAVLSVRGEDGQLPEEQGQSARGEHKSRGSGTKDPGVAVERQGPPEAQETTAGGEDRKFPEADLTDQVSVMQLPKENSRKGVKVQDPKTKEEKGGAPEAQEPLLKSQDEDDPVSPETHLEAGEHATLEEEDGSPQKQEGEGADPPSPATTEPGFEERRQRDQEPYSVQRGAVQSSTLYHYLPEKIRKQRNVNQEENQDPAQEVRASGPELCSHQPRSSLTSKTRSSLTGSHASQPSTRELLPGEDPAHPQQTSAPQTLEDK
ncbi:trichohyalin-like protein 1 [Ictidomys tridecemlineatus]